MLNIPERPHSLNTQGFDITPILQNPSINLRDYCYIENDEKFGPLKSRVRHLITTDYKLTVYEEMEGYGHLFDRKNDPDELNNLWYDTQYRDVRLKMLDNLLHKVLKAQTRELKRIAGS